MAKKSKPVKKALVKKTAPKKAAAKKSTIKKPAAKKAPVKKAAPVKRISKKTVTKKAAVKKPASKKAAAKKVTTKSVSSQTKKPVVQKKAAHSALRAKPKVISAASTPAMVELSEELVEKAANTGKPIAIPGDELNGVIPATENPVLAFDKHEFNKVAAKGDPHSKLHLSSKPKGGIKPSGKKPLWR